MTMAKFNFSITAHVDDSMMLVYSRDFFFNMTDFAGGSPVFGICIGTMPYRDWVLTHIMVKAMSTAAMVERDHSTHKMICF